MAVSDSEGQLSQILLTGTCQFGSNLTPIIPLITVQILLIILQIDDNYIHIPAMQGNFFKTQQGHQKTSALWALLWEWDIHKAVPIALYVSSKGTHNSALFTKIVPLNNGKSPYPSSTKEPPPEVSDKV